MTAVFEPVLVINSGWTPIHIKPTKDAIADIFAEVAEIVEHSNENLAGLDHTGNDMISTFGTYHNWYDWTSLSKTAIPQLRLLAAQQRKIAEEARLAGDPVAAKVAEEKAREYEPRVIGTTRGLVRGPEVIRLPFYNEVPDMEVRLTRRNLLLRDGYACQYCGKRVTVNTFTIDHVYPRSKGGQGAWDNFVVACFPCNVKKRDRTPEEAHMKLLSKPSKPKWYPLTTRFHHKTPSSWIKFLPESAIHNRPMVEPDALSERKKR